MKKGTQVRIKPSIPITADTYREQSYDEAYDLSISVLSEQVKAAIGKVKNVGKNKSDGYPIKVIFPITLTFEVSGDFSEDELEIVE
jgi:hypothetical protein